MNCIDVLMGALPGFEGNVPFFYLDSRGNVTIGIGHLVSSELDAQGIQFQGAPTAQQIADGFLSVKQCPPNRPSHYYRAFVRLTLADGWAVDNCAKYLAAALPALQGVFPGFDSYPVGAQAALLDMDYNLGSGGLSKWANLRSACGDRDWVRAANACHRLGISVERNDWTKAQFMKAADDTV